MHLPAFAAARVLEHPQRLPVRGARDEVVAAHVAAFPPSAFDALRAIVGSLLCYWLGAAGGKPLLLKYGKYVLVKREDLERTERFFAEHGGWTVFIARLLPVVRHFISIPAGIARMNLPIFLLQTVLGATLWGGFLAIFGFQVGKNWQVFSKYMKRIDLVIAGVLALVVLFVVVRWWRKRRAQVAAVAGEQPGVDSNLGG